MIVAAWQRHSSAARPPRTDRPGPPLLCVLRRSTRAAHIATPGLWCCRHRAPVFALSTPRQGGRREVAPRERRAPPARCRVLVRYATAADLRRRPCRRQHECRSRAERGMVHGRVSVLAAGPPSAGGGHGPGCGERRRRGGGRRECSRRCSHRCSRKAHGGGALEGARRLGAPWQLSGGARRARHRRSGGAGARAGCARRRGLCCAARRNRRGRRGRDRHCDQAS